MAISIDRLSLWEIAHRWHDADPSHSKTIADIPLDVKDTLGISPPMFIMNISIAPCH